LRRYAEQLADDGHGQGIGQLGDDVHVAVTAGLDPFERPGDQLLGPSAEQLDGPRRERSAYHSSKPGVVRWVEEQHEDVVWFRSVVDSFRNRCGVALRVAFVVGKPRITGHLNAVPPADRSLPKLRPVW
jgi:hypothetical protein